MVSSGYTGPEHHTGIIMDTGQGRVSAGQLGTAPTSHWISFLVAAAASAGCGGEGGSVYPRGDYKVSSRPQLPLL